MTGKKITDDKYRILCEKEEMIIFMANYAPYAPVRRVTNGCEKGAYEVRLKPSDFSDAAYIREPYHEEWNEEIFRAQVENLCAAWIFGTSELITVWSDKSWPRSRVTGARFRFAPGWTQEFEPEITPEKPAKRRAPRRKAPEAARENGAWAGWTHNRLGTKQIKFLHW